MTATVHAFPKQRVTTDEILEAAVARSEAFVAYVAAQTAENRAALLGAHRAMLAAQHRGDAAAVAAGMRRFELDLQLSEEEP